MTPKGCLQLTVRWDRLGTKTTAGDHSGVPIGLKASGLHESQWRSTYPPPLIAPDANS